MSEEQKLQAFNDLNSANDLIARAAKTLDTLWENGNIRLTGEDIEKFFGLISDIRGNVIGSEKGVQRFDGIANKE